MYIIYLFNLSSMHLTYKIKFAFNIIFYNLKAKIIYHNYSRSERIAENKN